MPKSSLSLPVRNIKKKIKKNPPNQKKTLKPCQIITISGFLSLWCCDYSCLQISAEPSVQELVTGVASQQQCQEGCTTCNYTQQIAQVNAASKHGTNICLSWQRDSYHKYAMQQAVTYSGSWSNLFF